MSKELPFLVHCLEEYKLSKGLTGKEVIALFTKHRVDEFVVSFFESLHINGPKYIVEEIDTYIAERA
ncbi:MAG: DUF3791 domain-containing protein [Clostridiales bacterium]|jgi:hypothetical protein|nr:DUF3791 domain-containing protein [Clostridiales bacterium]